MLLHIRGSILDQLKRNLYLLKYIVSDFGGTCQHYFSITSLQMSPKLSIYNQSSFKMESARLQRSTLHIYLPKTVQLKTIRQCYFNQCSAKKLLPIASIRTMLPRYTLLNYSSSSLLLTIDWQRSKATCCIAAVA